MNDHTLNDVTEESTRLLEELISENDVPARLSVKRRVEQVLAEKVEQGEVLRVTDEEERMIWCFRKFKLRNSKPGAVFKWQTHPEAGIVVLQPGDGALISDPRDVSA